MTVSPIDTDVVVVGAGPVGLFQVFQLGLLGLRAELVDVLPEAGGQCVALYADKPIYDVPGVPMCTGRELAERLLLQAAPFLPEQADGGRTHLHLKQQVESVQARPAGGFDVATSTGTRFQTRALVVAAGAGAFVPRALALPGWTAPVAPTNVHHDTEGLEVQGRHVVVAGGGEEALSTALALSRLQDTEPAAAPASVTLLHRRDVFQADAALEARLRQALGEGHIRLALGMVEKAEQVEKAEHAEAKPLLAALHLLTPDSQPMRLSLDLLVVRQGLSPKLGPLSDWGLALDRKLVPVDAATMASEAPDIHAVGDICTYPGKKRLLLCGFHEATLAAHHLLHALKPDEPQHLQYTTTSALLKTRLGVAG